MTPAEHYEAAERLLARADELYADGPIAVLAVSLAQLHATLATVPASAVPVASRPHPETADWARRELGLVSR